MRAGWTPKFRNLLHAADPVLTHMAEVVTVLSSDIKDLESEWSAADSTAGLEVLDGGGVRLADGTTSAISQATDDGTENADLDFDTPFTTLLIEWSTAGDEDRELENLTARLHPRPDGGSAKEVHEWRAQLFRVIRYGPVDNQILIEPVSKRVDVTATGEAAGDVTFDFSDSYGYPRVGAAPEYHPDYGGTQESHPITLVRIWAVADDGTAAGNVAWLGDSTAGASISGSGYQVTHYTMVDATGLVEETTGGAVMLLDVTVPNMPRFTLNRMTYTADEVAFTGAGNRIQGLSTTGDHRIRVQGFEPSDSSNAAQIRPAGGGTWLDCRDGDLVGDDNTGQGGYDLTSLSKAASYDIRADLTPSTLGFARPTLVQLGVEEITSTDLMGVVTVSGMKHRVDPRTLKGNITKAVFRFLKTGERDYRDYGSILLAQNHIGDIELRLWVGDPSGDFLARHEWMYIDAFEIEDYHSEETAHVVVAHSHLKKLRRPIPKFTVTSGQDGTRQPEEYANSTIKAASDDILDSLVGLPARLRGPGVPDTTSVSKTVYRADAKDEVDRLHYLAGYGLITSAGRTKSVQMMGDDHGASNPVAVFHIGDYTPLYIGPGFATRVDEFFVPWGWSDTAEGWQGESRYVNGTAVVKLGGRGLQSTEDLESETAKWVPSSALADAVARRVPNHFGNGLILWRIRPTHRHPHLEPGDPVVVVTDQFVARSPITDREIRGPVAALGRVADSTLVQGGQAEDLEVWVPSYDQIVALDGDVTRINYYRPEILGASFTVDYATEKVTATFQTKYPDTGAVRADADGTTEPSASDVRGEATNATDAEGYVDIELPGTYAVGATVFVAAFGYEDTSANNEEPTIFRRTFIVPPNPNSLKSIWLENRIATSGSPPISAIATDLHWQAMTDTVLSLKIVVTDGVTPVTTRVDTGGATEGKASGVYAFTAGEELTATVTPYDAVSADLGSGEAGEPMVYVGRNGTVLSAAGSGGSVEGLLIEAGAGIEIDQGATGNEIEVSVRITTGTGAVPSLAEGEFYGRHA